MNEQINRFDYLDLRDIQFRHTVKSSYNHRIKTQKSLKVSFHCGPPHITDSIHSNNYKLLPVAKSNGLHILSLLHHINQGLND